jgi:N-acetylglutamate synthase-like GNAT family acetyltransferase
MIQLRQANSADVPVLQELLDISVRTLQAHDYSPSQIEIALQALYGVDTQLIADGTYYIVEHCVLVAGKSSLKTAVGCGGWSKRHTLFGGDQYSGRQDDLLDPGRDAAKIRAFFVHPDWTRKGIGTLLLEECESAARAAGFSKFEMGATLTGVALYRARGYVEVERIEVPLPGGETFPIVHMKKEM